MDLGSLLHWLTETWHESPRLIVLGVLGLGAFLLVTINAMCNRRKRPRHRESK